MTLVISLTLTPLSAGASDTCSYCVGYQFLEKAITKIPAPKATEVQTTEHLKVVTLAEKVVGQIFVEAPKLDAKAMEHLVKALAKSAPYDSASRILNNHWDKLSPKLPEIEKTSAQLLSKKQISAAESERLKQSLSIYSAMIKNGNG